MSVKSKLPQFKAGKTTAPKAFNSAVFAVPVAIKLSPTRAPVKPVLTELQSDEVMDVIIYVVPTTISVGTTLEVD